MGCLGFKKYGYLKRKLLLLIWLMLCHVLAIRAQNQEVGIPPHRDFTPTDYRGNGQNFSVLMDARGIIYVANFAGVLEYDGTSWRTIYIKSNSRRSISKVNTLTLDSTGTVYVGARYDFGYLEPDDKGEMHFVSLMPKLDTQMVSYPDVIKSFATREGVYFVTAHYMLLWNGISFKATKTPSAALNAFYVNKKLYVMLETGGLQLFQANRFRKIPGGDHFSELNPVNALLQYDQDKLLVGSSNQGLFLISQAGADPFHAEANSYLIQNNISDGIKLRQGHYAFGTAGGGVLIVEKNGQTRQIFNKQLSGLSDDKTNSLFQDKEGGLWIALNRGLTRIDLSGRLVYFNEKKNVAGNVNGIKRFLGKLYIATDEGLFYYDKAAALFKAVPGIKSACWDLARSGKDLLVATTDSVYAYNGKQARAVMPGYALAILPSRIQASTIYVGLVDGLALLEKNSGSYIYKGRMSHISDQIDAIAEDQQGNVWLEVPGKGLRRWSAAPPGNAPLYNINQGLPHNSSNHLNTISSGLLVGTVAGVYSYNKSRNRFVKFDLSAVDTVLNSNWIRTIAEDMKNNVWTTAGDQTNVSLYRNIGNTYKKDIGLLPLKQFQVFTIYPEENGQVWLGSINQVIAFNTNLQGGSTHRYATLIRSIIVNQDTVFRGSGLPFVSSQGSARQANVFNSKENNLRFEFSTPMAMSENDLAFHYYLKGFDTDTIANWVPDREKEYSNLPPGDYVFHVKSKDSYGTISREAVFGFTIVKPFYQTFWAYLFYTLCFIGVALLFSRLRSHQILKEKKKLEGLIQERTEEVVFQKEELEKQSLELANKNDELEKINQIVKAINAEIDFKNLLQSMLEKTRVIRGAEKAGMLVLDKATQAFRFKAIIGYPVEVQDEVQVSQAEFESWYLAPAEEVFEDIFFIKSIKSTEKKAVFYGFCRAKSSLIMRIKLNQKTEAYLILENCQKQNAFVHRDFNLLKNLKEHFIAAFIKTTLLEDIQNTLKNLKETQEQLIRQEKLASIGQLTKGIVDRILNPLNYINNFSLLSRDLIKESKEILNETTGLLQIKDEVEELLDTVEKNLQKVNEHGASASRIVKGMEKILREKSTQFVATDINKLIETNVQATLQETKKEFPNNQVQIMTQLDEKNEKVKVLPTEMSTVLANLLNNAFFSVMEKYQAVNGAKPEIVVRSRFSPESVQISIRDNGKGIPDKELSQLFAPFFTTKPTAKGVGLGLFLSQDIVKEHKGTIVVDTKEGEFTQFTINIPKML
jgi:signal transduction histidine kinase/ligand-binding sensor domain-containing protein